MKEKNTTEKLTENLNGFKGLRKTPRAERMNEAKVLFSQYLKEFNHIYFKRSLVKSFFDEETPTTTRNRIIKELLSGLVVSGEIVKGTALSQAKPFLRDRELSCADNESYEIMMRKNGYSQRAFFNWEYDKAQRRPKKVLIAKLPINKNPSFDFDESELIQTKTRDQQKVLSSSQFSRTLEKKSNSGIVYFVK